MPSCRQGSETSRWHLLVIEFAIGIFGSYAFVLNRKHVLSFRKSTLFPGGSLLTLE